MNLYSRHRQHKLHSDIDGIANVEFCMISLDASTTIEVTRNAASKRQRPVTIGFDTGNFATVPDNAVNF